MSDHHVHDANCGCGHDHDREDSRYLKLTTDDGAELNCQVIDTFEVAGEHYIALLPDDSDSVFLYAYSEDGAEIELRKIDEDAEFDAVYNAFIALCEEEDDA